MSIQRRKLPSGNVVWVVRWRDAGQQFARNFDRKGDAEAFENDVRRRHMQGEVVLRDAGRQKLADFSQEWWRLYAEPRLATKTQLVYSDLWDRHVLPRLGGDFAHPV